MAADIQQKIKIARAAGYNDQQIKTYLQSQGMDASFVDSTPKSYFGRVLDTAKAGAVKTYEGVTTPNTAKTPIGLIGGGLKAGAGVVETLSAPITAAIQPTLDKTVGAGVNYLGDKIGSSPAVQKFANSPAGLATSNVAEGVVDAATIAGAVATPGLTKSVTRTVTDTASSAGAKTANTVSSTAGKASSIMQKPIPKNVETVLKETPVEKFDSYVNLAAKAVENNKNVTPLEHAGTLAQDALAQIQKKTDTVGAKKAEMMGIGGLSSRPINPTMVRTFGQRLQSFKNSRTATEGDTKLIRDIEAEYRKLGNTPSAGQVDRFIDFVQSKVYTAGRDLSIPVTDEATAALRSIAGEMNEALKSQLGEKYAKINSEYSRYINIRNELNTKLGKDGERGGALMKRVFSPSDNNTKQLFAEIQKETGIDLVNEATLARYVMDVMGDARQKSMLEQLQLLNTSPTPSGILGKVVDYFMDHFNSPEEIIKRARERTSGGNAPSATTPQQ